MKRSPLSSRPAGMVLVVVLALLVLITVAILAFFTHASANHAVEIRRTDRTKAVLLGQSAADYVAAQFLREITDPTCSRISTVSGVTVCLPLSNSNVVPARSVTASLDTNSAAFTLVRQSLPTVDTNASAHQTATAAKNGRHISIGRWNQPELVTGGFTNADQLPNWIYVDRTAGATSAVSANVIGRFAYNAYEVGGLLNVNVAGHPTTLTHAQVAELKGSPAGADLTCLGIGTTAISDLVTFRNPNSSSNAASYRKAVSEAIQDGFLSNVLTNTNPSLTNNYFTSRQDLLRYIAVKNPGLSDALPCLTHFSRAVNGPSWMPRNPSGSSHNYEDEADRATSANRNLPDVRFPSSGTVDHYGDDGSLAPYLTSVGDPLLQRRFSLARLTWLTPEGPSAELSPSHVQYDAAGTTAAIRSCFGLVWAPLQGRWEYKGHGTFSGEIKTLAEVAADHREPDFFEMLKAGILSGALGLKSGAANPLSGDNGTDDVQPLLDGTTDLQIIKIGVNIIDCADRDNYPTIVNFKLDPASGFGVELAGVEDLPYLHGVDSILLNDVDTAGKSIRQVDLVWTPIFFNPHSSDSEATISGPSSVDAEITRGALTYIGILRVTPSLALSNQNHDMTGQKIAVSAGAFRDGPGVATSTVAGQRLGSLVPYATSNQDVLTFRMFSFANNSANVMPHAYETIANPRMLCRTRMSNLQIALRFVTPGGIPKIYAMLGGWHDGAEGIDMGTIHADSDTGNLNQKNLTGVYYSILWDPRSVRLGPSQGWSRSSAVTPQPDPDSDRIYFRDPFNWNNASTTSISWGLWPQGGKTGGYPGAVSANFLNMRDPDGVTRPADGWLGNEANPYRNLSDTCRRPVILQRPFRTVAELGYVFRDSPWKTLCFFDETSGDGALLDLFCVSEESQVTAGRINLNTAPRAVIESLLSGTGETNDGEIVMANTKVGEISTAFKAFAFDENLRPTTNLPRSLAELPRFLSSGELSGANLSVVKYRREAIVRALADSSQTRTWNFLIDVIAQTGRMVELGTSESDFVVGGECRYWLSVAIDRYTGRVIDRQLELVTE